VNRKIRKMRFALEILPMLYYLSDTTKPGIRDDLDR
jgi:hypothetical protein